MKSYTVLKMMNIEYIVIFVINSVSKDNIKIISNHKPILITNIKENHFEKIYSIKYGSPL